MAEFNQWKEQEEEITHTAHVRRDRTYQPKNDGEYNTDKSYVTGCLHVDVYSRHYFVCCQDGSYRVLGD